MVDTDYDLSHYNIFSIEGVSNIIVGLVLFSIFLAVFYFTYASKIEKEILDIQVKNLIDDLTYDMSAFPNDINEKLRTIVKNISVSDLSKEDKEIDDGNQELINRALINFGIFAAISVTILTIFFIIYNIDLKDIVITNLILLAFIAITEVLFLNLIAKSYRSLDPNVIKLNIINKLQSFESSTI
jgi:hypothetical protein